MRRGISTASWAAMGVSSRTCAIFGAQWGDEGKGKLVDFLGQTYDVVARFNGGANAGHTVVVDGIKHALHQFPSGVLHPHTENLIGGGTVVDMELLFSEADELEKNGIAHEGRVFVSDRAHLVFNSHRLVDGLRELKSKLGTTRRGIGPTYANKAYRDGVRVGDILEGEDVFRTKVKRLLEAHVGQFQAFPTGFLPAMVEEQVAYARRLAPMIVDGVHYINQRYDAGKRILIEGANGSMLDLDLGTYPYVTSSPTTVGGVFTGLGLAPRKLEAVIGVVKAYLTRVGEGPFPTELTDGTAGGDRVNGSFETDIGTYLQKTGGEIGVTTGRKRRCGWLDMVALRYAVQCNGFTSLQLTKLDVLDQLKTVRIGVKYMLNGKELGPAQFVSSLSALKDVQVVYESWPGWMTDTSTCRRWEDLPMAAKAYIRRIEELAGCPVSWVGVGPGRDAMISVFTA